MNSPRSIAIKARPWMRERSPKISFLLGTKREEISFFVDCVAADGRVCYYYNDTHFDNERLVDLGVGFKEFWARLRINDR